MKSYYDLGKGLEQFFVQQRALEKQVKEAEKTLGERNNDLRKFNEDIKKEIVRELASGQTTGDPLTDEIVAMFGLDKAVIDRILAFNKELMRAKEILISASRQVCIKHVMLPTPGCENEYATETGYVYGIPSGGGLIIRKTSTEPPLSVEIVLPLKRYIKWNFERDNVEVPTEGPFVVDGNMFNDLSTHELLFSIIEEPNDASVPRKTIGNMVDRKSTVKVILVGEAAQETDKRLTRFGDIFTALEHGRREINLATPSEKLAGAGI